MNKSCPLVSIVIPVYNGSNYLSEAIDSALVQTYENIEILVVNDGSDDQGATERIALSYGDKIRYFFKENGGVASALNYGIEQMRGEYFSWLSHDDLYNDNKVSYEIGIITSLEDKTTFLAGGYTVVNKTGKRMYDVNLFNQYSHEELSRPLFAVFRGGINGCATLIHKSHFERVGVFNCSLPTTQDYDLWFRMLRGQKIYYYNACNVKSRTHEDQESRKAVNIHIQECNRLWIRMMSCLTDKERTTIDGSPYCFYLNTANFLERFTNYDEAIAYAKQQALKTAPSFLMKLLQLVRKNRWYCKENGIKATVKKIIKGKNDAQVPKNGVIFWIKTVGSSLKHHGIITTIKKAIRKILKK
jgi:glycosyltransferase involved in cell wall biosynthesis